MAKKENSHKSINRFTTRAREGNFLVGLKRLFDFLHPNRSQTNGHKQTEFDKKLVYSLAKGRIPNWRQLKYIKKYLSNTETWLLRVSFALIVFSLIFSGIYFYFNNLQVVPVVGGQYTEGLIGSPKYINPLYASVNDVDSDIASLIFSSLFKRGENGGLVNDLAAEYTISEDSKEYTITIIQGAMWHDDTQVTVDDIIFTFNAIKDNQYKSTLRNSFVGVDIERIDDRQVKFILSDPYAAFLEILTFGIIPADLWAQIPAESAPLAQLNIKPIGSGPYKFKQLAKDSTGNVREFELEVNNNYYGVKPFIDLKFVFFPNFEEAIASLNNNTVDGISYLSHEFKETLQTPKTYNFHRLYQPQLTMIFFNQQVNPALQDKSTRQALALAINRQNIVNEILGGDAYLVDSPILSNSFAYDPEVKKYEFNKVRAEELFDNIDWKIASISPEAITSAEEEINSEDEKTRDNAGLTLFMGEGDWRQKNGNYLIIDLKTVERRENNEIIEAIKRDWEAIGVKVNTQIISLAQAQEIIKERDFGALYYGQTLGADPDPYAFWHSSQTGENGFNIANFVSKDVDQLLEDARLATDEAVRKEKYKEFQKIITEEVPVIFMHSPIYTYLQSKELKGFGATDIISPKDRLVNISDWYLKTGKKLIWPKDNN